MPDNIIPLFEDDSSQDEPRPLPLYIAEQYNFALQHYDTQDGVLYSVIDWIAGIGSSDAFRATDVWNRITDIVTTLKTVTLVVMSYQDIHGKDVQSDFINDVGLYRIAEELRVTKSRPALKSIKDFLAQAGVFADEARRSPETVEAKLAAQRKKKWLRSGKEESWMANRNVGIVTRKELMAIIGHILGSDSQEIFKTITDDTYIGIFDMPAWEIRKHIGIPSGANVREFMSTLGIIFIAQAEELCRLELERYRDSDIVSTQDVRHIIQMLSALVGENVKRVQQQTGRDVITGRKMLPSNTDNNPKDSA